MIIDNVAEFIGQFILDETRTFLDLCNRQDAWECTRDIKLGNLLGIDLTLQLHRGQKAEILDLKEMIENHLKRRTEQNIEKILRNE